MIPQSDASPPGGVQTLRPDGIAMDIGLDTEEDFAEFARTVQTIELISTMASSLKFDARAGELFRLAVSTPEPPVDLRLTISSSLTAAVTSLEHIKRLIVSDFETTAPVLQSLLRSALLGAGRVVFVLAPSSPKARLQNATIVLRQDSHSLIRGYEAFSKFTKLQSLVPPAEVVEKQKSRFETLRQSTPAVGESELLRRMSIVVGDILVAKFGQSDQGKVAAESVSWIFNVYSGIAHGYGWPQLVPGTSAMPGHFVADLSLVTSVAHLAVDLVQSATRPN